MYIVVDVVDVVDVSWKGDGSFCVVRMVSSGLDNEWTVRIRSGNVDSFVSVQYQLAS